MSIKARVYAALSAVLGNTHAVELPKEPAFPAIVFEVETEPEASWCQGGGYDQHKITAVVLAATLGEVEVLRGQVIDAMGALSDYNGPDAEGDADYEHDADIYGYYIEFQARTPRWR